MFNDGGGATKQKQYTTAGSRTVQVRVTDSHGGQDTDQVTVDVGTANVPARSRVTFLTRPGGLEVKVGGKDARPTAGRGCSRSASRSR